MGGAGGAAKSQRGARRSPTAQGDGAAGASARGAPDDEGGIAPAASIAPAKVSGHRRVVPAVLPGGPAMDVSLSSWPFVLVQGMVFLVTGYMLRGCVDRRRKRLRKATLLASVRGD